MSRKLGINVAVGNQHIRPSVIIIIKKADPPSHEAGIEPSACRGNHVCKSSVAVVMVQVGRVVDKIGLENIQEAIAIIIARRNPHAGLRNACITERSVPIIAVKQTGSRITGNIYILPAAVAKVGSQYGKGVSLVAV